MASEILIPFPPVPPTITISNLKVADPVGGGAQNIIKATDAFDVSVDIAFAPSSPLLHFILGLGLTLEVDFAFEGFGGTTETTVGPATKTTNAVDLAYPDVKFNVPAGTLVPGVYKFSAILKVKGGAITLAVGFLAEEVLQVY